MNCTQTLEQVYAPALLLVGKALGVCEAALDVYASLPPEAGYITAAVCAIALLVWLAFRPRKRAPAASTTPAPAAPTVADILDPLARLDHKVELIAACLKAGSSRLVTGVHVYYAAPGGMKLHASVDCTLLSHSKELATLTVSADVHAFLLRAQTVCARCGHEAPPTSK